MLLRADSSFEECPVHRLDDTLPPTALHVLDNLDCPLLVIDKNLRIRSTNANALRILGCDRNHLDFGRHLVGETDIRSQTMRRQARAAVMAGTRTVLMLGRPDEDRLICSLKGLKEPHTGLYGLVALQRLGQAEPGIEQLLRDIYGFSPAEAQIAVAASNGLEVSQIVLERHISIHTLRAQIASIKSKMGVSRMTEVAIAITKIRMTAALV